MSKVFAPQIQPDGYISEPDFKEMRALGMNDPKEFERLKGLSTEELLKEYVDDCVPAHRKPTLIVIDDFYTNPDAMRDYALSKDYVGRGYHGAVGNRTNENHHPKGIRKYFEDLLGKKICDGKELGGWDYATNGVFQHCMAEDPFVIHCDDQELAAIIYLTPDAPVECGTTLYQHKETKQNAVRDGDWSVFKDNFYDKTPFEEVDRVGNRYNRMILMDGRAIHAATQYFGDNINNDRLFHIFFFSTEEQQ